MKRPLRLMGLVICGLSAPLAGTLGQPTLVETRALNQAGSVGNLDAAIRMRLEDPERAIRQLSAIRERDLSTEDQGRLLVALGHSHLILGDHDAASAVLENALALDGAATVTRIRALYYMATLKDRRGAYEASLEYVIQAAELLNRASVPFTYALINMAASQYLLEARKFAEAHVFADAMRRLGRLMRSPLLECAGRAQEARLILLRRGLDPAGPMVRRALDACETAGYRAIAAGVRAELLIRQLYHGEPEAAVRDARALVREGDVTALGRNVMDLRSAIAVGLLRAGRVSEAIVHARALLRQTEGAPVGPARQTAYLVLRDAYKELGDQAMARRFQHEMSETMLALDEEAERRQEALRETDFRRRMGY
ncbi:hypothetical protein [Yunchengibacter salinarum]|uniref:hypothetical protein n=1 Tax=Yunchengibacter salinarum TaxID=3133399 RepID=UPI0035B59711